MRTTIFSVILLIALYSCQQPNEQDATASGYHDLQGSDIKETEMLFAVTDEEHLEYGARVAYVDIAGDTVIPFGNYAYFGTDTLVNYAFVMESSNDGSGKQIAIDRDQNVLFDLVMFDNGPDPLNDGLMRVLRNGKMGYANQYGQVVIPCNYDYAKWFDNGVAEVTFKATEHMDGEHKRVESDEWFSIDLRGQKVN